MSNETESEALVHPTKRISHSVRAVVQARSAEEVLRLYFNTAFDFLSPRGLALWQAGADGVCHLIAEVGESVTLPPGYTDWCAVNHRATMDEVTLTISTTDSDGADLTHVVVPSVVPSRSYLILHILVPDKNWVNERNAADFLAIHAELLQLAVQVQGSHAKPLGLESLSDRQRSILERMAQGQTYRTIADALGYSESTIKQEALKIFEHLSVSDRHAAVAALRSAQPSI